MSLSYTAIKSLYSERDVRPFNLCLGNTSLLRIRVSVYTLKDPFTAQWSELPAYFNLMSLFGKRKQGLNNTKYHTMRDGGGKNKFPLSSTQSLLSETLLCINTHQMYFEKIYRPLEAQFISQVFCFFSWSSQWRQNDVREVRRQRLEDHLAGQICSFKESGI